MYDENIDFLVTPRPQYLQDGGKLADVYEGFLPALLDWCRKNNVVFIADEVQTGFARTGAMFAAEHAGVVHAVGDKIEVLFDAVSAAGYHAEAPDAAVDCPSSS